MARKSYATPFKASARAKRQYKQIGGCLMAPFMALFKGIGKGRKKRRRRRKRRG